MKPTKQQELILNHNDNSVVIAAPGSGKTFVLSEKIKINLKSLLEHQGIIAISYTNKASTELKNRSLSNGENPKSSFFGTIDKFNLSEIIIPFSKHIFGIPKNDFKITKITSLPKDEQENFNWFTRDLSLEETNEVHLDVLKSYYLQGLIMIETIGLFANYVFTNSIACQNYIKAKYKHIYIDEYQDSGLEQHQLFLKIKELDIKAIAVGDLNQSIYAFSGKDAKFLIELTKDKSFKYFKLDKNHRCHPSIINYSNYLLNPKTELIPIENNFIFFSRVEGSEADIANWIDSKIETITENFEIKHRNKIAILTRGNRTSEIINNTLKAPHKLLISNDLDNNLNIWSAIFSNLLHFIFDKNFKFIDVIQVFTSYEKLNSSKLKSLIFAKQELEKLAAEKNLNTEKIKIEFIKIASIIAPNSENTESVELLVGVLNTPVELNSYKPSNDDEINILTLHKSKGLEYDIVIHLDLYEWVFPNKQPGPNNDFNNPLYGDWTQDLNLHYVGITRARNACFLVSSTKRTNNDNVLKNGKDSEFIFYKGIENLRFSSKKSN
jgi:superfamily I DNA/RNA helicase